MQNSNTISEEYYKTLEETSKYRLNRMRLKARFRGESDQGPDTTEELPTLNNYFNLKTF